MYNTGYASTNAPTSYNTPDGERTAYDESSTQPGGSGTVNEPGGSELESIYSCDSLLDETNDADYDDDDDPFDLRTKQYLSAHGKELKFRMLDPLQQYAELKVANVLHRGTLAESKIKKKLEAINDKCLPHKVITTEYREALKLLKAIKSHINKEKKPASIAGIFNMIMKKVTDYFEPENIKEVPESELHELTGEGSKRLENIFKLTRDLVSSSSDEGPDFKDDESSGDEPTDFKPLNNLEFIFPTKNEESLFTPSFVGLKNESKSAQLRLKKSVHPSTGSRGDHKPSTRKLPCSGKLIKKELCSKVLDLEDLKISKKKMIIIYREQLYRKLQQCVSAFEGSKVLMRHKLFRIWNNRQKNGLESLEMDIFRRKTRLEHRIRRAQKLKKMNKSKIKEVFKDNEKPKIHPEIYGTKNRRWKRTAECMREKEKILMAKQGRNFLSGFLGDRAGIKTERVLGKEWPEIPVILGVPPAPPRANGRVLAIIGKFMETENSDMTYGDLLRLIEGDASFIMEDDLGPVPGDANISREISYMKYEHSNFEYTKRPSYREWNEFIRRDSDFESPFLTKREMKNYKKMLNEKFFPDPNFKIAEECVAVDENALIFSNPGRLKMNYSLKDLEKDFYEANSIKCSQSRAVYFFQYKSEYTPIDIQAAYEHYVHENIDIGEERHVHPCGCLLIYKNVKLAVVMIEGQVDHLYYHFADFRNSPLYKFIEVGRVLYYSERVSRILHHWISIVAEPLPGEISYFTNSKKVLHRVAEPRIFHMKRKLHDLYSYMSTIVVNNRGSSNLYDRDEPIPANMKAQIHPCPCQKCDPQKLKSDIALSLDVENQESESGPKKTELTAQELLPSPALIAYLLKYRKLRTIDGFLDEFVMQPVIGSDDEKFNVIEDAVVSNYVDSDDERDTSRLIKEMKRTCKEREILNNCQQELMDILDKPEQNAPWVKSYDLAKFTPKLKKVQVRKKGDNIGQTIDVDPLIDSDDESDKPGEEEQYLEWYHENEKLAAQRKFLNFIDTGAESWQKKVKRFGLTGRQVKEMLRDARKYKNLRKILQLQDVMKTAEEDISREGGELEDMEDEQGDGDKEYTGESKLSLMSDTMDEIEALLDELGGETNQFLGEDEMWPPLTGLERLGEYPEHFGEREFQFDRGFPTFEWDDEVETAIKAHTSRAEQPEHIQVSSDVGENLTDQTQAVAEEEETVPEAPPATSVTDTSTDP